MTRSTDDARSQRFHAQPSRGGRDFITTLTMIAKVLKLYDHPGWADFIEKITNSGNQKFAERVVRALTPLYHDQQLRPNHFRSFQENLDGEFVIGHTDDGRPFGLSREELVRHVFLPGQSGTGKTNCLDIIFSQAQQRGVHVVYMDRKSDFAHMARHGIDVIHWSDMRVNPLEPASSAVSIHEHRNNHSMVFGETMQFQQRGRSVYREGLDAKYKELSVYARWPDWNWGTMRFPTLLDLRDQFKSRAFGKRVKGQGLESMHSIIDKLEGIIIEMEPIVSCQRGHDIVRLHKEGRAVVYVLDGISVDYQNFLIQVMLLRYAEYFKACGPRNRLNMLFMFDEAKGIVGEQNKDNFVVKDLISTVREFGIGVVAADQIPSEISQAFFSNVGTLFWFRLSDGVDLRRVSTSAGATMEQARENYSLRPGQAIVRSMKTKDLVRVTMPFTPVEKFISREELGACMASRLEELDRDVVPHAKPQPKAEEKEEIQKAENREAAPEPESEPEPASDAPVVLDEDERAMLECVAKEPDRPVSVIYNELGLGKSAGHRVKERLVKKGYVSQVTTNLGKDGKRAAFLVPNPVIFDALGIALGPGRGKALHKHFQAKLKTLAEQKGYKAVIEEALTASSEGADVGLSKDGKRTAVEVCVTSKPSQEVQHIRKNFRMGYDRVVMSFVNRDVLAKTQQRARGMYPERVMAKVDFCLVNEVARLL